MEPGKELWAIAANLVEYLRRGVDVKLAAVIFARPETSIFKNDILPSLSWFQARSGRHCNFYFAGYRRRGSLRFSDEMELECRGEKWVFSPTDFDKFRQELESRTQWRYSGGTDVLLTTGHAAAALDFEEVVAFNLEQLRADGAMLETGMLFERIFQAAESHHENSVLHFSDSEGKRLLKSAALEAFVSILPESLRADARKARHFAVRSLALK